MNIFRQRVLKVFRNVGRDGRTVSFVDCNGAAHITGALSKSGPQAAFHKIMLSTVHRQRIFQTLGRLMPKGHKYHRFQFAPDVLKHMVFSINFPNAFNVQISLTFDKSLVKSADAAELLVEAWTGAQVQREKTLSAIILTATFDPSQLRASELSAEMAPKPKVKAPVVDEFADAIAKRHKLKSELADRILALEKQIAEENKKYTEVVEEINTLVHARNIIKGD